MGIYMLLSIMAGWVLLTFVSETIILAGRDWCVDKRKTPVYYRMFDKYEYEGFCAGFWMVLATYTLASSVLTVLLSGAAGWLMVFMFEVPGSNIIVAVGMIVWGLIGVFLAMLAAGVVLGCCIFYPIHVISEDPPELVKGVSNWKNQIKDKYCPIVTKEEK